MVLPRSVLAVDTVPDPNYLALVSDIHLHADRNFVYQSSTGAANMWQNFQQVSRGILALPVRPAAVLINGDVAFHEGLPGDYATAIAAMTPLREAGLPVHWAVGNHDDRTNIAKAAARDDTLVPDVAERRVMILPTPAANIFIMDSLTLPNKTPGLLGDEQLAWLAAALDRHADHPAIVFVHHNPFLRRPKATGNGLPAWGNGTLLSDYIKSQNVLEHPELAEPESEGSYAPATPGATAKPVPNGSLVDTIPLLNVLLPRKQVKAWFFGHTHAYSHKVIEGMHLVNLPATGWLFAKNQPLGWMDMRLATAGARLELHCLEANHPLQHDRLELKWRVEG
jgi:3',5'-cyclic AMP phosphodiesterase CpdA